MILSIVNMAEELLDKIRDLVDGAIVCNCFMPSSTLPLTDYDVDRTSRASAVWKAWQQYC